MRKATLFGVTLVCLSVVLAGVYAKPMITSALGLAARQACSLELAAGIPLSLARETYIDRHIRPLGPYVSIQIDASADSARASLFNLISANATHRNGFGCVLDHGLGLVELESYAIAASSKTAINHRAKSVGFDADVIIGFA